jgi:hypothetical protein
MVRVATLASTVHAVNRASKAIAEAVASSEAEGVVLTLVAEGVGARLGCHGETYEICKRRNKNFAAMS